VEDTINNNNNNNEEKKEEEEDEIMNQSAVVRDIQTRLNALQHELIERSKTLEEEKKKKKQQQQEHEYENPMKYDKCHNNGVNVIVNEESSSSIIPASPPPTIHIDHRYLEIAQHCDANNPDQVYRLVQSALEYSSSTVSVNLNNGSNAFTPKRRGIAAPFRRVLVRDDFVRDGPQEMDVSIRGDDVLLSPSANHVPDSKFDDETVRTMALLLQRLHIQQRRAAGFLASDEDSSGDEVEDSETWSFKNAKRELLSDENAAKLGLTWIALAELKRKFDPMQTSELKNDIYSLLEEGESFVLGNPRQLSLLRNIRARIARMLSQRFAGISTPKLNKRVMKLSEKKVYEDFNASQSVRKNHAKISTSVLNKEQYIFESNRYGKNSDENVSNFTKQKQESPVESICQVLKETSINCDKAKEADKNQDTSKISTPLRRSKRLSLRLSMSKD